MDLGDWKPAVPPGGREPLRGRWDKYSKCIAFRILLRKLIPSQLRLSVGADADIKPQQGRFERRQSSSRVVVE